MKRAQEKANSKVQALSEDQRNQLETNLARQRENMTNIEKNLERRKKLLNDAPAYSKGRQSSSEDDDSDEDRSDESAW